MLAPLVVSVAVCCPAQIVALFTATVGKGFTVTAAVVVPVHPPLAAVMV